MNTARFLVLAFVIMGTAACSRTVAVRPSNYPASEVMTGRKISTPTGYTFTDNFKTHGMTFECAAFSYKAVIGAPLAQTIKNAIDISFDKAEEVPVGLREPYNIRVDLDDMSGHTSIQPGFWSATVFADVSLSARVNVTDQNGADIAKAEVSGTGEASVKGSCAGADQAIQMATEKAVKKLGSDFVFKIINSNTLH